MMGNVLANALVIFILIKTKQLSNVACKLIFMRSISDFLIGTLSQNIFFAVFYGTSCFIKILFRIVTIFLTHWSGYIIAVLGIDWFIGVKYYTTFKTRFTKTFILVLMAIACSAALTSAVRIAVGLHLRKERVFTTMRFVFGVMVIIIVTLLQVLAIQTLNAVHSISTTDASQLTNKKIVKLSTRIMVSLMLFCTPYLILTAMKARLQDQLNKNGKSILEFILCVTVILTYTNSLVNAILFLTMNVKVKRFLQDCKKALSCFMQNPSCWKNKSNITKKQHKTKKKKEKAKHVHIFLMDSRNTWRSFCKTCIYFCLSK